MGLDWIGLDWMGLDWMGWIGWDWMGLDWMVLDWAQGAEWGMRHGRGGQQAVGQTLPRFWHSCKKGGSRKKNFIFTFFFREPTFA